MTTQLVRKLLFALTACSFGLSACSTYSPSEVAHYYNMTRVEVDGDGFRHLVYLKADPRERDRLHVYIEGDGTPWVGNQSNPDPTPRLALALNLATDDNRDILYVGRPCYFGVDTPGKCGPKWWTSHRYSEEVIASMASVIEEMRGPQHTQVVLIGHSGGGAIAALLAPRINDVVAIITVTANLDTDAWTEHHGYDPLTGSLNPAKTVADVQIPHYQYVGRDDRKVPPSIVRDYGKDNPQVKLLVYDGYDHVCCWENDWDDILSDLSEALDLLLAPEEETG